MVAVVGPEWPRRPGTKDRSEARGQVLLEVDELAVEFPTGGGPMQAVRGVSLQVRRGEVLGIVGESGAGKSVTALAVMGLLPGSARVSGSVRYRGRQLLGVPEAELNRVRGRGVSMILQDPMTSLNPVHRVGDQIAEAILAHRDVGRRAALREAAELLDLVRVPDPGARVASYPHELSGGTRQRVVIAIAIANAPDVIIADEPTTALDVTVQAQVLEALTTAKRETAAGMLLITHDLGVIAGHADRVGVMYAGRVVETGTAAAVFSSPRMPYTVGLLASQPRLDRRAGTLIPVAGAPPSPAELPPGCPFAPRCPIVRPVCGEREPGLEGGRQHRTACHAANTGDRVVAVDSYRTPSLDRVSRKRPGSVSSDPLLSVGNLVKHFPVRSTAVIRRHVDVVHAVCDVSFDLHRGETLGLVGESGCGKSTVARVLLNLQRATSGSVRYRGTELTGLTRARMRPLRRELQIVFQDAFASLDPRMRVEEIVAEPLRIHGRYGDGGREQVRELLRSVGLSVDHGNRFPHEFSGGQRQRIGLARALALRPRVLVLDEPVSALDVSVQAGVLNLLATLQYELGLSYLFISHDLSVVRHVADRVAVMYLGRLVEVGATDELFDGPAHPYTQALISAIPVPDPDRERNRERIPILGEVAHPIAPPSGCRFRSRCPLFVLELTESERRRCMTERPELLDRGQGHPVACHHARRRQLL